MARYWVQFLSGELSNADGVAWHETFETFHDLRRHFEPNAHAFKVPSSYVLYHRLYKSWLNQVAGHGFPYSEQVW